MQEIFRLFFGDDQRLLEDVAEACTIVKHAEEAVILGEEDTGSSVYYLLQGTAKTVRYSSDGAEVWLDEIAAGTLFGEMAALGAATRTATIVASSEVIVAIFTPKAFLDLLERHGSIGIRLAKLLARRVENTTQRMFELAAFSSKGRVYAELLRRARPVANSAHVRIENMPSMAAIARQLSNTRETVSRTVNELEKDGLIKRKGACLTILAPDALRDLTLKTKVF